MNIFWSQAMNSFLITIDTEGDNLWNNPSEITTHNSKFIPRFQSLCEKYDFKPTYLVNYEMAICPIFKEFARDCINRNTCEIGMHLHAWNSPPIYKLSSNDYNNKPYLIEYPEEIIREKIVFMTNLLEDTFDIKMYSHRAGRWAFNSIYAKILYNKGYRIDCSVTPNVSWKNYKGDNTGNGGVDYTNFPNQAYFMDLENIHKSTKTDFLEIPMTIIRLPVIHTTNLMVHKILWKLNLKVLANKVIPTQKTIWFRSSNSSLNQLLEILDFEIQQNSDYIEYMLHSSEFMPGGSPYFSSTYEIDKMFDELEIVFQTASKHFKGSTLKEFYEIKLRE